MLEAEPPPGSLRRNPLILGLTDTAEADLAEIWAYIAAEASEAIATRFLEAIEAKFAQLLHSPLIGSRREQFGQGLRVVFHRPYLLLIDRLVRASVGPSRMSPRASRRLGAKLQSA